MLVATNVSRGHVLADRVRSADSFGSRLVGLLGTRGLAEGEGLWLSPCSSVHTFFMRYAIDVLFLGRDGVLLHGLSLRPWRMSRVIWKSHGVLELPFGALSRTNTRPGDRIDLKVREF